MKTLKVVRALSLAFISLGAGYTPYALADKMQDINIGISGYIESETCSAISAEGTNFSLTFPSVPLASFKDVNFVITTSPGLDINFSCPSGMYANAKFYYTSPQCISIGGSYLGCGGVNKSVGVAPYVIFEDYTTKRKVDFYPQHIKDGTVRKVAVNEKKEGTITIGKRIFLGKVKDLETQPGEVSTDMVLELWVD